MLNENTVAKILEYGLQQGADFTEVFVEDSVASSINLLDQKIEEINSSNSFGKGCVFFTATKPITVTAVILTKPIC